MRQTPLAGELEPMCGLLIIAINVNDSLQYFGTWEWSAVVSTRLTYKRATLFWEDLLQVCSTFIMVILWMALSSIFAYQTNMGIILWTHTTYQPKTWLFFCLFGRDRGCLTMVCNVLCMHVQKRDSNPHPLIPNSVEAIPTTREMTKTFKYIFVRKNARWDYITYSDITGT